MPPLIGWAAVSGRLNSEAWALYAILFLWQFPHFMASHGCTAKTTTGQATWSCPRARREFLRDAGNLLPLLTLVAISIVQFPARHAAIFYCASALLVSGSYILA